MSKCTLHNLLTTCLYNQVFFIYRLNNYDENILLAYGTKQEMLESDDCNFELLSHINDTVDYWTIRKDGAMFVRLEMEGRVEDLYDDDYVKEWKRFDRKTRPYLYSTEIDDFGCIIHGKSKFLKEV